MIEVENLTKYYGSTAAVRDVTFSVEPGEILGFLGPNGAGKTTTMRMITGYLPPTSGKVRVAGFDMADKSLEARSHLGYLPESVPLYTDLTTFEYLDFRGRICGLRNGRERKARTPSQHAPSEAHISQEIRHPGDAALFRHRSNETTTRENSPVRCSRDRRVSIRCRADRQGARRT